MKQSELIEELFHRVLEAGPDDMPRILSEGGYSPEVCQAVNQLVAAHNMEVPFLNATLIDDALVQDPEFFDAAVAAEDSPIKVGDQIGSFTIVRELGSGGMSLVFLAEQSEPIKRQVALKIIRPNLVNRDSVARFKRELQTQDQLEHPNIATFFATGVIESQNDDEVGLLYAALQYIDGPHLNEYVAAEGLTASERIKVFCKVLDALACAHQKNIVHRDVKPSNILVDASGDRENHQPKLIDFGISKVVSGEVDPESFETTIGHVVGSPRYMSVEQLLGLEVSFQSDIYSSGLVLIEILTDKPHRRENSRQAIIDSFRNPEPETIELDQASWKNNDLSKKSSERLIEVIKKAISERTEDRYASIDQFRKDLNSVCQGEPTSIADTRWIERALPTLKKYRFILVFAASILLLAFAAFFFIQELGKKQNQISKLKVGAEQDRQKSTVMNQMLVDIVAEDSFQLERHPFDSAQYEELNQQKKVIQARGGPVNFDDQTVYILLAMMAGKKLDFAQADAMITIARARNELPPKLDRITKTIYEYFLDQRLVNYSTEQMNFVRGKSLAETGRLPKAAVPLNAFVKSRASQEPGEWELAARLKLLDHLQYSRDLLAYRDEIKRIYQRFCKVDKVQKAERGSVDYFELVSQLHRVQPNVYEDEFNRLKQARLKPESVLRDDVE